MRQMEALHGHIRRRGLENEAAATADSGAANGFGFDQDWCGGGSDARYRDGIACRIDAVRQNNRVARSNTVNGRLQCRKGGDIGGGGIYPRFGEQENQQ